MEDFGFSGNVTNYNSGLTYLGTWDALNNVPILTSGVGTNGAYYIVNVAGNTNLDGVTDWQVGDWAIFVTNSPNEWQKIDNHDVQAYDTVQNQGVSLIQRSTIDFQGAGVTTTDNGSKTIVTIPSNPLPTTYGLFAQITDSVPITGTIVESTLIGVGLGTLSVPANAFSIGDSFTAFLDGKISCVGTATLHIKVKTLAGVLLADTGIIAMDAATIHNWKLDIQFTIRALGTTGIASISSGGLFGYIKNSGNNYEGYVLSTVNNTTFDTTISNTLLITAQWNTNNAGNSIFSRNFTLTKIY
jgi:hypothetical protein